MNSEADFHAKNQQLLGLMRDDQTPVNDRADALIYTLCDGGLDYRPLVQAMISEADVGRKLQKKLEAQQSHPLARERFVGRLEQPRLYAVVTRRPNDVYLPAEPEDIEGLRPGDPVLIDMQDNRIVARDGEIPPTGDVVCVESLPPDRPQHVLIEHHNQCQLARLHHGLFDRLDECRPGSRVLYEPSTGFVLEVVDTKSDGSELLTDLSKLGSVRRTDIGAPNPVADEIRDRVLQFVEHPDWVETMHARTRTSYLFVGGTGVGKSYTLQLIANEVHDVVEHMTGERTSRFVMTDAAQFWDSLFGRTEQRIAAWADALQKLGARPLEGRDGRVLHFPLIIVLEECEALLRIRGDQTGSGHLFDRPLSLLLQKTESLEKVLDVPLIWIATTNRADLADPAALRRLGMRRVTFGNLNIDQATSVLATKVPEDVPLRNANGDAQAARDGLFRQVLGYLYGEKPSQGIAEIRMTNSERRILSRCALVTPAVIEEAVSAAIDQSLRESHQVGELLGLQAEAIIRFLHRHYSGLARTLTRFNLPAHCPEWFEDDSLEVASVTPLTRRGRRAVGILN